MGRNLLGILLLVAGAGVGALWAYPLWLEVGELGQARAELNVTVNRVKDLAQLRDDLLERYNSISPGDLASLGELLPRSPQAGLLLINLENLSRSSGLLLKAITMTEGGEAPPGPGQPPEKVSDFPFQISVSGTYASFRNFLALLEVSQRLMEIDQLSFDAGEVGAKESYEFNLKAHAYWRR